MAAPLVITGQSRCPVPTRDFWRVQAKRAECGPARCGHFRARGRNPPLFHFKREEKMAAARDDRGPVTGMLGEQERARDRYATAESCELGNSAGQSSVSHRPASTAAASAPTTSSRRIDVASTRRRSSCSPPMTNTQRRAPCFHIVMKPIPETGAVRVPRTHLRGSPTRGATCEIITHRSSSNLGGRLWGGWPVRVEMTPPKCALTLERSARRR